MASTEAWGGPSGNSLPLIQTVSAGATPESLARCANAASVRPTAIIPAKARRENIRAPIASCIADDASDGGCDEREAWPWPLDARIAQRLTRRRRTKLGA